MQGKKSLYNSLHRELKKCLLICFTIFTCIYVCGMHAYKHTCSGVGAQVGVGALHVCMCVERSGIDYGNFPCFLSALYKEITLNRQALVSHSFNSSIREAEAGEAL